MSRLDAIAQRRAALLGEIARTRDAARLSADSLRGMLRPVSFGMAAGQALGGSPLLRVLGLAGLALTLARRWFAAR